MAGTSYFDPAAKGQAIRWPGGRVSYYTDQGPLAPSVTNTSANAMVAAAAAVWNQVPTAAVSITAGGTLAEDVSGATVTSGANGVTLPPDVQSTATGTPVGVVYDADGAVLDAIYGYGASDPLGCRETTVTVFLDNLASNGTLAHALMLLNGRCLGTAAQLQQMQYDVERGFGQVLGLDWSQASDAMFQSGRWTSQGLTGWPLMHPLDLYCVGKQSYQCLPNPMALRADDVASVSRVYPVSAANLAQFPGKQLTATATVAIRGTVRFRPGQGMQGVNVIARPLLPGTSTPDDRYPATAVTGFAFHGDQGNPVNGYQAADGSMLARFGSDDLALEGWYDLSGIPLPTGAAQADYAITLEAVNPLYLASTSVGPYTLGSPTPSGTMPTVIVRGLSAGASANEDITVPDSADDTHSGDDGSETQPVTLSAGGEWLARVSGYGHAGWFAFPVRGNREFTVEAQALDEAGRQTENKARVVLGLWNGTDAAGTAPVVSTLQPFNGAQVGQTYVQVVAPADTTVRLGVADQRGDGRPDYLYRGRVLYADSITPERLPLAGGTVTIKGTGFRAGDTVAINGTSAMVTEITPTQIVATAQAVLLPSGSVDVVVHDPVTLGDATLQGAFSYDAATTDVLTLVNGPSGNVGVNVPVVFSVEALTGDLSHPVAGISVTFTVTNGIATLGPCGSYTCNVTTDGNGIGAVTVTASAPGLVAVTATIASAASSVRAEFTAGVAPAITALTPELYVAAGASFGPWPLQALVLTTGSPLAGQSVAWSAGPGVTLSTQTSTTGANRVAAVKVLVAPLPDAALVPVIACVAGSSSCATFEIASVHTVVAQLVALSGAGQNISAGQTPAPVVLEVEDGAGHPMAGGLVQVYERLQAWAPDCPTHGRCASAPVLGTQSLTLTSDGNGLVSFAPLSMPGVPSRLSVTALLGNGAAVTFTIEQHP